MATTDFVVKNGLIVNQNLDVKGTTQFTSTVTAVGDLVVQGNTTIGSETSDTFTVNTAALTTSAATFSLANTATTNLSIGGAATTLTIGNAAAAQTISIGNASTGASTYNFGTGTTATATTKTINIGTGGTGTAVSNVNLGVSTGGTTTISSPTTIISGDLTVNGTTTTINATTITVDDKNIELGSVASPDDTTADGGGITLRGATNKTIIWTSATSNWISSQNFQAPTFVVSSPTNDLVFSNAGTTTRGIKGTSGGNDQWFFGGGASAADGGFLEISTGDNGNEPIYVRQYDAGGPPSGTLTRTATLLDASGNTVFPGTVQGTQLISTIGTGTAPFTVASTTVVTNLNADLLDGISEASFLRSDATDAYTSGTLTFNSGTTLTAASGATVNFNNASGTAPFTVASTTVVTNLNADRLDGIHAVGLFNNMGDIHTTRSAFDVTNASYDFGFRFVQGSTNGPGTGGTQYYSWYQGLGSEYPATGAGSYGMYCAIDRDSTTPYLSIRYNENNVLSTWRKISAGKADSWTTARTLSLTGDVTGTSAVFDGSGNISITTTIAADSVTLGTDTTGNYMVNVSAGTGISVSHTQGEGSTATISLNATTTNVSEGTNLYYTDARARAAVSFTAGSGAYNSSTGVFTIPTNTNQLTNGAGFITGYTETDTLSTVTGRGASTTTACSFTGGATIGTGTTSGVTTRVLTSGAPATTGSVIGTWTLGVGSTWESTAGDLAEWYDSDEEYVPGTVVIFGGTKEITIATSANDTRVAGVITTTPAFIMNVDKPGPSGCVALQGKVPIKVVGQVQKGDLLVSSNVAGYAMTNNSAAPYTVIGKALENKTTFELGVVYTSVGR